jgi:hypothetical protein
MNSINAPVAGSLGEFALEICSLERIYDYYVLFLPVMGSVTDFYALSPTGC